MKCKYCGKEIIFNKNSKRERSRRKYCSMQCHQKDRLTRPIVKCLSCGKSFKQLSNKIKYCSEDCYNIARHANKYKPCLICGKPIKDLRKGRKKYCSNNCRYEAMGKYSPNYNLFACSWFKKFDEINNTSGLYATNPKEFYVREACAFVDYINHDLKIIIEWLERGHFIDNKLKNRDIERFKRIKSSLPDYYLFALKECDHVEPFVLQCNEMSIYRPLSYESLL